MSVYTNSKDIGKVLKKDFLSSLKTTTELTMATGYIGESFLSDIKAQLIKIAKKGSCRLLVGMVFHEGVTQKQKDLLVELHNELVTINGSSGVFISRNQYHGKVYHCISAKDDFVYLGSSNLSDYGFYKRLECTIKLTENNIVKDVGGYLTYLFKKSTTNKLDQINLKVKSKKTKKDKPSTLLSAYEISKAEFDALGSIASEQNIELRVDKQPNSSLNLYYDKGRKNKGRYSPRPWYEVELTTSAKDRTDTSYPKSISNSTTSNSRTGSFNAFISENGKYFKIKMVVHSDFGKNISSAKESGGRETLGRYIKGKLQYADVLRQNERITSETLELYERSFITLKKIDDDNYILEF